MFDLEKCKRSNYQTVSNDGWNNRIFASLLAALISFSFFMTSELGSILFFVSSFSGGLCLIAAIAISVFRNSDKNDARRGLEKYLINLDMDTLIKLSESNEIEESDRVQIISHLNKFHPGWSLKRLNNGF